MIDPIRSVDTTIVRPFISIIRDFSNSKHLINECESSEASPEKERAENPTKEIACDHQILDHSLITEKTSSDDTLDEKKRYKHKVELDSKNNAHVHEGGELDGKQLLSYSKKIFNGYYVVD